MMEPPAADKPVKSPADRKARQARNDSAIERFQRPHDG